MPGVTLAEIAKIKTGAAATGGNLWTPDRINEIVSNIRGLVKEAMAMRQGLVGLGIGQVQAEAQAPGPNDPRADSLGQGQQLVGPGQGVTMPQLGVMVKGILTNLEAQGYGDKTPFEVLQSVTLTIRQIKGMIP